LKYEKILVGYGGPYGPDETLEAQNSMNKSVICANQRVQAALSQMRLKPTEDEYSAFVQGVTKESKFQTIQSRLYLTTFGGSRQQRSSRQGAGGQGA
jgi:hypothetical protein